jgi:hypothetical protein
MPRHSLFATLAFAAMSVVACGGTDDPSTSSSAATSTDADAGFVDAGPAECTPSVHRDCGSFIGEGEMYPDGGYSQKIYGDQYCDSSGHWTPCQGPNTPIVLSFDGSPVILRNAIGHFELGQGASATTLWPAATTPWLTLDRNSDGLIGDGSELFGSLTPLTSGAHARNGFEALAELDSNGDGVIDARDAVWAALRLWSDRNGDRVSDPTELTTLTDSGVESISLQYLNSPRCDSRGNCEVERAAFLWHDDHGCQRRGAAIDIHLAANREAVAAR